MATFTYEARAADGKRVDGTVKAGDRNDAIEQLKKKNLTVVTVAEEKAAAPAGGKSFGRAPRARAKTKDICILTRQLATMISAGIPLLESLEILCEQTRDPGFRRVMDRIIERVRSGTDFSTALAEHPRIFTDIFVNMIKAGEASGNLDVILNRLADYLEATEEIKREVKSAMVYPVVSLSLIIAITIGLIVGIVPKFKAIFDQLGMGDDLPPPTKFLMMISTFMTDQFFLMVGCIVAIVVAFIYGKRTKPGKRMWHKFTLKMPVFGQLVEKVVISRFSRTFSTLIQSGVPMLGALDIVAGTAGNVIVEEAVLKAKDAVSRGETLGEPLAATRVFPPMVTRMITIGEKTGALEKLLSKISDFYDSEVKAGVKSLTSLIEPIMIGTMGLLVGSIVLAIFMPIIKIQQRLGGGS